MIEESAIQRVTQRQRQQQQQTSDTTSNMPAATALANSVLAQELALVAEAKRVSEQEASGTKFLTYFMLMVFLF